MFEITENDLTNDIPTRDNNIHTTKFGCIIQSLSEKDTGAAVLRISMLTAKISNVTSNKLIQQQL